MSLNLTHWTFNALKWEMGTTLPIKFWLSEHLTHVIDQLFLQQEGKNSPDN